MYANRNRLFLASCVALVTTAMVFSIRADILDALGADFHLNKEQIGIILSPAFWGFTLSILIGGSLVDWFGMRRLLYVSSFGFIAAVLAILFAPTPDGPVEAYYTDPGFIILYGAMLTLGLAQGLVEGVINPLCTTLYAEDKTHRMNVLHAWWPGGLIIGGLAAYGITKIMGLDGDVSAATVTVGWQIKLSLILIGAAIYAYMIRGQEFPATERVSAGVSSSQMLREALRPMFLLWWVAMWMTAATELGPDQWVGSVITNLTGMSGILILVYTAGIMFVLRFYGGPMARRFSPMGVLTLSAILSGLGLLALSYVETPWAGFRGGDDFRHRQDLLLALHAGRDVGTVPQPAGAFLLAVIGGTGNLSVAFVLPLMGGWYDAEGASAAFRYVAYFPLVLTFIFGGLFFYFTGQSAGIAPSNSPWPRENPRRGQGQGGK